MTDLEKYSEQIFEEIKHIDENGAEKDLVEKNYLKSYIDSQAGRSMRDG